MSQATIAFRVTSPDDNDDALSEAIAPQGASAAGPEAWSEASAPPSGLTPPTKGTDALAEASAPPSGFIRSIIGLDQTTQVGAEEPEPEGAEIIDLVQLPAGSRPFPRVELELDEVEIARALHCESYNACLSFAATVKWRGFHCRRCPKFHGEEKVAIASNDGRVAPVIRLCARRSD